MNRTQIGWLAAGLLAIPALGLVGYLVNEAGQRLFPDGLGHYLNHREAMEDARSPFHCEALAEEMNQKKIIGDRAEGHYNAWRGYCYLATVTHDEVRLMKGGDELVAQIKLPPERAEDPLGQFLDLAQSAQSGNLIGLASGLEKLLRANAMSCSAPRTNDCEAGKRYVKFELSH